MTEDEELDKLIKELETEDVETETKPIIDKQIEKAKDEKKDKEEEYDEKKNYDMTNELENEDVDLW